MKKLLLASLTCVSLLSCNRDNDNPSSTSISVVGKWKFTKDVILNGKDKSIISSEVRTGCESNDTIEFRSDKTCTFNYYDNSTGTCKLSSIENGTYTYNSNTKILSIIADGVPENVEVYSLTNSEVQIIDKYQDENNDGTPDLNIIVLNKL